MSSATTFPGSGASLTARAGEFILVNGRVVTETAVLDPGWVTIRDRRIHALGTGEPDAAEIGAPFDLHGQWLLPGFVDVHVHGGGGASFNTTDASEIATSVGYHLAHGTTRMLASIVTAAPVDTRAALSAIDSAIGSGAVPTLAGAHLEGPFISPDRPGCHDVALLRTPDVGLFDSFTASSSNQLIKMVTLATELPGARRLIDRIRSTGAIAALGHSTTTYEGAGQAFDDGVRVITHLHNAMNNIHHREPGIAGAAFDDERIIVELIADGTHIHDEVIRLTFAAAPGRIALVTDAVAGSGLAPGTRSRVGSVPVIVHDDKVTTLDGETLAGSTLTMDAAIRRCLSAGLPIIDVARAAASTPAALLGEDKQRGAIAVGLAADLVVLDPDFTVSSVIIGGVIQ